MNELKDNKCFSNASPPPNTSIKVEWNGKHDRGSENQIQ